MVKQIIKLKLKNISRELLFIIIFGGIVPSIALIPMMVRLSELALKFIIILIMAILIFVSLSTVLSIKFTELLHKKVHTL